MLLKCFQLISQIPHTSDFPPTLLPHSFQPPLLKETDHLLTICLGGGEVREGAQSQSLFFGVFKNSFLLLSSLFTSSLSFGDFSTPWL